MPFAASGVSLSVGDVEGAPGETVGVTVRIETDGLQLGFVGNDITFAFPAISLNFRGAVPDCSLAAGVGRQFDIGLTDGGARLRATVIPLFPSGPIRDGPLYFCGFTVSPRATAGIYPLVVSAVAFELLDGTPVAGVKAGDGSITVRAADPIVLDAGEEEGVPGGLVSVPIHLVSKGRRVAATTNEIGFDRSVLRLNRQGAQPDCEINPLLGKILSVFVPADGDSVLVQVLAEPGVDPMPDGELYRCAFAISPAAPAGAIPLHVFNVMASDPEGTNLVGVVGSNGAVIVEGGQIPCEGDCDGDSNVTVDELVRAVNIALGLDDIGSCSALDQDLDETATVDELVAAVGNALSGC